MPARKANTSARKPAKTAKASRPPGAVWKKALSACADPARAAQYGEQLAALRPGAFTALDDESARVLAAVLAGSRALAEQLLAQPAWLDLLKPDLLRHPRRAEGLRRDAAALLDPAFAARDYASALAQLRAFKQREMLRIAARDLARFAALPETIAEISNVADLCLDAVCRSAHAQLAARHGEPYALAEEADAPRWAPATFCVLGLGKHGGQELNYSSDIDVLFVYSGEGETFKTPPGKPAKKAPAGRGLPNHQFFARLAEAIIAECTRMTPEGFLYRVDLRLRPEGKSGPLARSLASYENYYASAGQTWERMMLLKARCAGGDSSLGAEFLEMIHPFRYPRVISEQIPREVAEMKQRIEAEVVRSGELERNVKLGRGGIREIEFLAQTLHVLHAGRLPFLQGAQTLPTLEKLARYQLLTEAQVRQLTEAYCFLRDLEHRLQMEDNRQTHTMPTSAESRERLARLMGFASLAPFEARLLEHRQNIRAAYDQIIQAPAGGGSASAAAALPADVQGHAEDWAKILEAHSFREPERCVKLVRDFVQGPGFGHRSSRTVEHSIELMRRLLALCPRAGAKPPDPFLSDPDRVLARLDSFTARYGARAMLYDAWAANPSLFRLLLLAFDRSEHLAELAIRVPDLIDEIEQSGQLRRQRSADRMLADLRQGASDPDQARWLRRYFQAEQMRLGLRDILDLATPEQTQEELTALADATLEHALETILRRHRLKTAPFAIVGLGKLGGRELIYASDLDILFVAEDRAKNLPLLQKAAAELIELLSARTEEGATFEADARLRPDGEKGLLVKTVSSYAEYYAKRAMLWEIQALSRFRPICGHAGVIEKFTAAARRLTDFSTPPPSFAAFTPDWPSQIHRMRLRIEKERTPPGQDELAIKTGRGGLMDAEFIAQTLCLRHGWRQPNTLAALAQAASAGALPAPDAAALAGNYRKLMQIERILRRWSFQAESLLPADPAAYYRVAVRCGFPHSEAFRASVAAVRAATRAAYNRFFGE